MSLIRFSMTILLRARCCSTRFYCRAQESVGRTRREILFLGHGIAAASALSLPSSPSARKLYTNLEEAREAGEARREEKERAQGPIITLPSGVRELDAGSGRTVAPGDVVSVQYVIYRLNGMYLDSLGYGNEGKDDVGEVLTFQLGGKTVPRAVELGMEGMKLGGKRRILVNPDLGWTQESMQPQPTTAAAGRRLMNSFQKPLLFEIELVKISDGT
ncbi:peptidyl-prolyl cis-trans isomerase FKBP16-1, chloroplastic-like isoform X2 [Selaginella moellendorffii]|uniref:peptidyl-prolyl cis-trans isomerase FKBP16-1, chloroplastic-like isoform X2 n=1 Tax=Selaginella moellendorffii TaxID=88036 RepID=UPI000D1C3041|nr:peptidyl-prolyl cis-trans isomerase FKBP16-1, chloroplastic-like isoform X2 [Selaginella moellendorffii]|eukprot:XP_024533156.1 peptidyl-prolyl cis-trans isomerase FKBP16-1, chloroplastic-like isoform X2 [Selaginella moellendorffii]